MLRQSDQTAKTAADSLYGIFPVEAAGSIVIDALLSYLSSSAKWNSKIAALDTFDKLIDDVPADLLELKFVNTVPVLTDLSTD